MGGAPPVWVRPADFSKLIKRLASEKSGDSSSANSMLEQVKTDLVWGCVRTKFQHSVNCVHYEHVTVISVPNRRACACITSNIARVSNNCWDLAGTFNTKSLPIK